MCEKHYFIPMRGYLTNIKQKSLQAISHDITDNKRFKEPEKATFFATVDAHEGCNTDHKLLFSEGPL